MRLILLLIASTLLSSSCSLVKVKHYVHEDTAAIRNALDVGVRSKPLDKVLTGNTDDPLLIPDFFRFWHGKNTVGRMRVITGSNRSIVIEQVTIASAQIGKTRKYTVDENTSPEEKKPGIWVDSIILLRDGGKNMFVDADQLEVTLVWKERRTGATSKTITFQLKRIEKTEVAWIT